jgi:small subunit ribosomal protein S16
MAVVIRMRRTGAKKRPSYRIVVADSKYPRDGRYIEQLGYYDPLTDPATFRVDAAKFEQWIRNGARPSESVEVMMKRHAPQALRPALPAPAPAPPPAPEGAVEPAKKAKRARAEKPKPAAKKKAAAPRKGDAKKAKTRAKAKTRKSAGIAKPKAAKKAKK